MARTSPAMTELMATKDIKTASPADLTQAQAEAELKRLATRIAELDPDLRREEIARMLAGAEITAEARAAAERLMQVAAE